MDFDKYRRNRVKNREPAVHVVTTFPDTLHQKILSGPETGGTSAQSPLNAEKFASDDNISNIDHEDIRAYLKLKTDGFHIISNLEQTMVSDLKNLIAAIGNINEISNTAVHLEVILTLIQSWELFEKVITISSNPSKKAAPYRFELAGIFFKAATMPK